jgi:hypothetical protein
VIYALRWYYEAKIDLMSQPSPALQPKDFQKGNHESWQDKKRADMATVGLAFKGLSYQEEDALDRWFLMESRPWTGLMQGMYFETLERALSKIGADLIKRNNVLECCRNFDSCKRWCLRDRLNRKRRVKNEIKT